MAKKKQEKIVLEDIELKPQVIGYTYKKKTNIGRVIIIFIIFLLCIIYIDDISLFINDLIGKETPLSSNINKEDPNKNNKDNKENEIVYNVFSNTLEFSIENLTFNNFSYANNELNFDIENNTDKVIDLSNKKYFIETYLDNKTLLERYKLDIKSIVSNNEQNYQFKLNNDFYYIVVEEKNVNDYPVVTLNENEQGIGQITCSKESEQILYTFHKNELYEIKHTINENDIQKEDYYTNYSIYQNKATTYNNMDGITATFNSTLNGYSVVFALNLEKVNFEGIQEKYYFSYKEVPKVVKFEMQTYGFNCN